MNSDPELLVTLCLLSLLVRLSDGFGFGFLGRFLILIVIRISITSLVITIRIAILHVSVLFFLFLASGTLNRGLERYKSNNGR